MLPYETVAAYECRIAELEAQRDEMEAERDRARDVAVALEQEVPNGLTLAEVADARGVAVRTVRRWIAAGLLPAYRVGPRLVRIRPDDLEQLDRRIPADEELAGRAP